MSDNNNSERNGQIMRIMTIVGFVVLICLLAWLAVQVVRFMPTVFTSLANVFEENQRNYAESVGGNDNNGGVVVIEENGNEEEEVKEDDGVVESDPVVATPTPNAATSTVTTTAAAPTATKPAPVQYKTVTSYKKPVSDPNGHTDLSMTFVGVGSLNASQSFVVGRLPEKGQGAIQFVVKNTGTKTSGDWTFKLDLPNGSAITSNVQKPLLPNESSTLTIAFEMDDKWHDTSGVVLGGGDINTANNAFSAKVAKR